MSPALRILIVLLFAGSFGKALADFSGEFDAANRLYEKGDYAAATAAYQKLASGGQGSAGLLFNLGNAHFKNGQPGRAIAAYIQAERLAPRDPDIRANLRFARHSVPGNSTRAGGVERALKLLSLNELGACAAAAMWLCFGGLAAIQLRPALKSTLRTVSLCAGIFAVVFGAWFGFALADRQLNPRAVVIVTTSSVRFGPLEESQVSFNVRDGIELKVGGRKDQWVQVTDTSNRTGWILATDVTLP